MKTATASRNAGLRPVTVESSLDSGWDSVIPSKKVVLKLSVSDREAWTSSATIWKVRTRQPLYPSLEEGRLYQDDHDKSSQRKDSLEV